MELGPLVNFYPPGFSTLIAIALIAYRSLTVWSFQDMENGQGHINNHLQFFLVYGRQRTNTTSGFCPNLEKMANSSAYNQTNTISPRGSCKLRGGFSKTLF